MFEDIFDVDLSNCAVRPELIDDKDGFYHKVHCDHHHKKLSIIIYIDKEDDKNLASDLYCDENIHHSKLEWHDNCGVGWRVEKNNNKWHGFDKCNYIGVRRIMIINWVNVNKWNDHSQLFKNFRFYPCEYNPNKWNKIKNPIERGKLYENYMDWLGGLYNLKDEIWITDNVDVLNPSCEDNLYKKLKSYILLCRRVRDCKKAKVWSNFIEYKLSDEDIRIHLKDLQTLLERHFEEIVDNLITTKWFSSILMCFFDLGTPKQKNFYKKIVEKLIISKIDWSRGRTMFSEDKVTNENWFKKIKSKYKWKSINDINIT